MGEWEEEQVLLTQLVHIWNDLLGPSKLPSSTLTRLGQSPPSTLTRSSQSFLSLLHQFSQLFHLKHQLTTLASLSVVQRDDQEDGAGGRQVVQQAQAQGLRVHQGKAVDPQG